MNGFFDFPDRLPTNEAWGLGGSVTVLGVVVVFVALVLLIVLTFAYPKFFGWLLPITTAKKAKMADKKAARQLARAQAKAAKKATIISVDKSEQAVADSPPSDDPALIAVITAAIAASLGTSSNGIRIKSLRRSGASTPAWGREGKYEQFRY
ncbi:MAG: hypothetical protein HN948_06105 [Clostridia bacterium]|jgi:glutaconyl-CoA/methylmalonyl-CoA decarboxylase subunit delta|nr:hypothetical protein [Clostridia bacterium]MBT7122569.1 hypothetical protein [Clostridia bacterium]